MKKIFYTIIATVSIFGATACSDMLEADSSRQLFDPSLDQKTDSVFYAYGIMQAMQQLADQYYFQNEMRGDLVKPTSKASTHLRDLAEFNVVDASNKYDSVYLYYKVINNCNYYLAHRDTTLATGKQNVVCNEYAAVASFRAWTYLQLARQYGKVPYVTEPVTTIGQINANTTMTGYNEILEGEAAMLEELKARYSDEQIAVPTFNQTSRSAGRLNWNGQEKYINPRKCFIPLNVVLGDIYLELGEYEKAAICYFQYLRYTGLNNNNEISVNYTRQLSNLNYIYSPIFKDFTEWPADYNPSQNNSEYLDREHYEWINSFGHIASPGDVISYIPMAVNYTMGKTTDIPASYGYNYYGIGNSSAISTNINYGFNCPKTEDIQIVPSQAYCDSARRAQYYYYKGTDQVNKGNNQYGWDIKNEPFGDARAYIVSQGSGADSSYVYTYKPSTAYILLYRNTTVWLHLAEAVNRMGYPDIAFAILKNGIYNNSEAVNVYADWGFQPLKDEEGNNLVDEDGNIIYDTTDDKRYLTSDAYKLLTTKLPFLSQENTPSFNNTNSPKPFIGIHKHGAGAVDYLWSTYRYIPVLNAKIADISDKFNLGLQPDTDGNYTKEDYINAMEDLLCDEYAMEFAFEGTRFSDLRRLAIHKNREATYGGNFGDTWLSHMLQNNAPGITTQNCYLPYK